MLNAYSAKILNNLLDKYESNKKFVGQNKVDNKIYIEISKLFKAYLDETNYDTFSAINEAVELLISMKYVSATKTSNNTFNKVFLTETKDNLLLCYKALSRTSKTEKNNKLITILNKFAKEENKILNDFCKKQLHNITNNICVKYFQDNYKLFEDILICVLHIQNVETETYLREFSVKLFNDSKRFELIQEKVRAILFDYGDFGDKETIFEELNVLKNPSYVNLKGNGCIIVNNKNIPISEFKGGIGISSLDITAIEKIRIENDAIITVENLTSFYTLPESNKFVIYLGGFHNTVRCNLLKKIYEENPNKKYYHFGDIDAGGLLIFKHLLEKTGIPFIPYKMDIETIINFKQYCKSLTENDKIRLRKIVIPQFNELIRYMLDNNCKLEQEAIN